tara:strand:+ start:8396 stop:9931 length:1536 start_codon:yes stop_codon:yes gene_type:complete
MDSVVISGIVDKAEKIVKFSEMTCGIGLYDYQREFAQRVVESVILNDGDEITALFSRQSGKTEAIAVILVGLTVILPILAEESKELGQFKEGLWVGLFAPVHEQVMTTYERAMVRIKSEHADEILGDPEVRTRLQSTKELRLSNGSYLKGMSAARQTHIESKSFHIVIIEEAQDVDSQKVRKSIHPMLSAYNGTMVKIGTPNSKKSDFWDAIRRNKAMHSKGGKKNHFEFDYKKVIKGKAAKFKEDSNTFHLKYEQYIKKEKDRIGLDSDEFRMSYALDFIMERGMFMTDDLFESMLKTNMKTKDECEGSVVLGLDVGKSQASSVLTVVSVDLENPDEYGNCPKTLINWYEITDDSYETQFFKISDIINQFNVAHMVIDATGVGEALSDRFIFQFSNEFLITAFKFSTSSKSEIYKYLDMEIRAGRILVPASARTRRTKKFRRFKTQFLNLEKEWQGAFMNCHKPSEKWANDDYCDSFALAMWAGKEEVVADVEQQKLRIRPKRLRRTAYW